jgi:hypothetical protein
LTLATLLQIQSQFPLTCCGLASFSDVPTPQTRSDYPYLTNAALTSSIASLQQIINSLQLFNGGDIPNSQFQALSTAATTPTVQWSVGSSRVIIMVTSSPAKTTDPVYTANQTMQTLLVNNVIPIFLAPAGIVDQYTALVQSWGFGYSATISLTSPSTIFASISSILSSIVSTAQVILQTPGQVVTVFPQGGYTGVSPLTRVAFTARLSPGTVAANLVVPGFGSFTITPSLASNPTAASQSVTLNLASGLDQVITLAGSTSSFNNNLGFVITTLPLNGNLYQWGLNGALGTQITSGTLVTDIGHRVIYAASGSANQDSFTFRSEDYCGAFSPVSTVQIVLIGVVQRTVAIPSTNPFTLAEGSNGTIILGSTPTAQFATVTRLPQNGRLFYAGSVVTTSTNILSPFTVVYVPNSPYFSGTDSFAYTATGVQGVSLEVQVRILLGF